MHDCLIAFGSNQGDSECTFESVCERLKNQEGIESLTASRLLQTMPIGGPDGQPTYLNAALRFQSKLTPAELHALLVEMEEDFGRVRTKRWGARKLDLDLLIFGREILETESLIVPHPRMTFRRFVIEPANEIAADMIHPVSGCRIDLLLSRLNQERNLILLVVPEIQNQSRGKGDDQAELQPKDKSARDQLDLKAAFQIIVEEDDTSWELELVQDMSRWDALRGEAKLVAYVQNETPDSLSPLLENAIRFGGPTLRLPTEVDLAATEFKAAIDSMSPSSSQQVTRE